MTTMEVNRSHEHHNDAYELSEERLRELTSRLLAERPPQGDDRFVCYKLEGLDEFADIGRKIESEVFYDAFGNTPEDMEREYGKYESQSTFFVSIDREKGEPTGALRIIRNGPSGLKTLNDFEELFPDNDIPSIKDYHGIEDLKECWDIGTVAVRPEYRSAQGGVSIQLYRGMYVAAMQEEVQHFVSAIDAKPLSKLTKYLGIPFVSLVGSKPFEYIGSKKSQAVYGHVPDFYRTMNRRRFTPRGMLARKALSRLVKGTKDSELQF